MQDDKQMWKNKDSNVKGIWQQLQELTKYEPQSFNLENLKEFFDNYLNEPFRKHKLRLPCSDYPNFTDEEFKSFIENCKSSEYYDYEFIGGSIGYNKMRDRMNKLNIKL